MGRWLRSSIQSALPAGIHRNGPRERPRLRDRQPTCHASGSQCNDASTWATAPLGTAPARSSSMPRRQHLYPVRARTRACPVGCFFAQGPSIDGHITINPVSDASFRVERFTDPFPSIEDYFDDGCGTTYTLIQNGQGSGPVELNRRRVTWTSGAAKSCREAPPADSVLARRRVRTRPSRPRRASVNRRPSSRPPRVSRVPPPLRRRRRRRPWHPRPSLP
jgi:hypothetical protein